MPQKIADYWTNPNKEILEQSWEREQAEKMYEDEETEKTLLKFFIVESNRMEVNPDNVFSNRNTKERLLIDHMGYNRLKVEDGYISIERCKDARIGNVFKRTYYSALEKLKK